MKMNTEIELANLFESKLNVITKIDTNSHSRYGKVLANYASKFNEY